MLTFVYISRSGTGEGVFGLGWESCIIVAHFAGVYFSAASIKYKI